MLKISYIKIHFLFLESIIDVSHFQDTVNGPFTLAFSIVKCWLKAVESMGFDRATIPKITN